MIRCPFAAWRPISTNYGKGGRQRIRGFVPHVQVGNGSLYGFFNTPKPPGSRASADFWCSKTGVLEQYVDLTDQSYAQGSKQHNGNPYMVSCEFEGYPNEPMTPAQINTGGRLIAWILTDVNPFDLVVNTIPGNDGITPHHVFGGGHTCPGPGPREGQFPDLIAAAQRWLKPQPINLKGLPVDIIANVAGAGYHVDTSSGYVMPLTQKGADALRAKGVPDIEFDVNQGDDLMLMCQDIRR